MVLMIILSGPGKAPDYSFLEKSQGQSLIEEDDLDKEEDRLSGTWHCSARQTSGPGNYSFSGTVSITQRGSRIRISAQGRSVSGTIRGNSISISSNYLIASIRMSGTVINDNRIQWSITARANNQGYRASATFTR